MDTDETLNFVPDLCSIVVIHYARMLCCSLYFIYFVYVLLFSVLNWQIFL